HGCLVALSAINCIRANRNVQDYMRDMRSLRRKIIKQRLLRGVKEGDLPSGLNISTLAYYYTAVIDGLAIAARDGASRKALKATAACAMAAWDKLVAEQSPDQS